MVSVTDVIPFKSEREYFDDEKKDLKNNTTRIIDMKDKRFQDLLAAWKEKRFPQIRIDISGYNLPSCDLARDISDDKANSFMREIRHIAIYGDLMIITWEPRGEQ